MGIQVTYVTWTSDCSKASLRTPCSEDAKMSTQSATCSRQKTKAVPEGGLNIMGELHNYPLTFVLKLNF